MSCGCDKIKGCQDVCNCLDFVSSDSSILIKKHNESTCGGGGCQFDIMTTIPNIEETPFDASSNSLVITPGGDYGHTPNIEIVPSKDLGNIFYLGSDGKPFVRGTILKNNDCLSFTSSVINGVITYIPHIDWNCVATNICGKCAPVPPPCSCNLPVGFNVYFDGRGAGTLGTTNKYYLTLSWILDPTIVAYTAEYKLSSSAIWLPIFTNKSFVTEGIDWSIIIDLGTSNYASYDVRIKSICQGCSSDWITLNTQEVVTCSAPSNVVYDAKKKFIIWQAAPLSNPSSFELLLRRDDVPTFSKVAILPIESPLGSGTYIADFSSYPFTPDYVYHFCIGNRCGYTQNVISDHGQGCAFSCVVPLQSNPTVANISTNTATIDWTLIKKVTSHTIQVFDNTTGIEFKPTTDIGYINTYNLIGLLSNHEYIVTIGYICGTFGGCVGKTVTFITTNNPLTCLVPLNLTITAN